MKLKLKKLPKKPKASASLKTKENYLKKVREITSANKKKVAEKKKSEKLTEKIRRM